MSARDTSANATRECQTRADRETNTTRIAAAHGRDRASASHMASHGYSHAETTWTASYYNHEKNETLSVPGSLPSPWTPPQYVPSPPSAPS